MTETDLSASNRPFSLTSTLRSNTSLEKIYPNLQKKIPKQNPEEAKNIEVDLENSGFEGQLSVNSSLYQSSLINSFHSSVQIEGRIEIKDLYGNIEETQNDAPNLIIPLQDQILLLTDSFLAQKDPQFKGKQKLRRLDVPNEMELKSIIKPNDEDIIKDIQELKKLALLKKDNKKAEKIDSIQDYDNEDTISIISLFQTYENLEKIEEGKQGQISKVFHESTNRFYIKVKFEITEDEESKKFAEKHEKILKKLSSIKDSRLLQISQVYCDQNVLSVLAEYGQGTLKTFLVFLKAENLKLDNKDIISLYLQLKEQIEELSVNEIYHCDINLNKIIIMKDGYFKLTDFRKAQIMEQNGRQDLLEVDLSTMKNLMNNILKEMGRDQTIEDLLANSTEAKINKLDENLKEKFNIYLMNEIFKKPSIEEYEKIEIHLEHCSNQELTKWIEQKYKECHSPKEYRFVFFLIAQTYKQKGNYEKMMKYYNLSLEQDEKFDETAAFINFQMGNEALDKGNYKDAELYLNSSLEIRKKLPNQQKSTLAKIYRLMGLIKMEQNLQTEADKYFATAQELEENDSFFEL